MIATSTFLRQLMRTMTWNNTLGLIFSSAPFECSCDEQTAEKNLLKTKSICYIEESGASILLLKHCFYY